MLSLVLLLLPFLSNPLSDKGLVGWLKSKVKHIKKEILSKTSPQTPVVPPPAGIGWSIPMVPLGSPVFRIVAIRGLVGVEVESGFSPTCVETIGVRPVIWVKGVSPGDAMERGVNMAKFVPPIMGTEPIPRVMITILGQTSQNKTVKRVFFLNHIYIISSTSCLLLKLKKCISTCCQSHKQ